MNNKNLVIGLTVLGLLLEVLTYVFGVACVNHVSGLGGLWLIWGLCSLIGGAVCFYAAISIGVIMYMAKEK